MAKATNKQPKLTPPKAGAKAGSKPPVKKAVQKRAKAVKTSIAGNKKAVAKKAVAEPTPAAVPNHPDTISQPDETPPTLAQQAGEDVPTPVKRSLFKSLFASDKSKLIGGVSVVLLIIGVVAWVKSCKDDKTLSTNTGKVQKIEDKDLWLDSVKTHYEAIHAADSAKAAQSQEQADSLRKEVERLRHNADQTILIEGEKIKRVKAQNESINQTVSYGDVSLGISNALGARQQVLIATGQDTIK